MLKTQLRAFFQWEPASGVLLMVAAGLALIFANIPATVAWYQDLLSIPFQVSGGSIKIEKPLLLWINDGLMAIFFLSVGLEIKREFIKGHLAKPSQILLPGVAALGGMLLPALIYVTFNYQDAYLLRGWAIPSATDIAFTMGVLALLGSRIPVALKVFVMTLAVLDDLGAVVVIALFYTGDLSTRSLVAALICTALLLVLNRSKVRNTPAYMIVGAVLWVSVLKSGVHATLAGIILAMAIPMDAPDQEQSIAERLMEALHPWVAFGILPLFAFANAGVSLAGLGLKDVMHPVPVGIALGLFLGKQLGIVGFSWCLIRSGVAMLPTQTTWRQLYGAAILCGIGFTMSLFISSLAFEHSGATVQLADRLGILVGSMLSAIVGYWVLHRSGGRQQA